MSEPRTRGVYAIRNRRTNKYYVGRSEWVEQRLEQHRSQMAAGCHPNPRLRGAVKYSGIDNFEFRLLERVDSWERLPAVEAAWIHKLDSYHNGYNRTDRTAYAQPQIISWPYGRFWRTVLWTGLILAGLLYLFG